MSAIEALKGEYEREIDECEPLLRHLSELDANSANEKTLTRDINECEKKMDKIRKCRKNLSLELTQVKDRAERAQYLSETKYLDEKLAVLTKQLQTTKQLRNKLELVQGSTSPKDPYGADGKSNDELLEGANKIQDLTFDSLGRTRIMIEQSKEIGLATVDELRRQRVQIVDIDEEIDHLDSHVSRAEKLVANFTKRIASDRVIQAFTALNVLIIICVIVYAAVTGKTLSKESNSPDKTGNLFGTPSASPTASPSFRPTFSPT